MTIDEHIAAVRAEAAGLTGFDWLDRDKALVAEIDRLREIVGQQALNLAKIKVIASRECGAP